MIINIVPPTRWYRVTLLAPSLPYCSGDRVPTCRTPGRRHKISCKCTRVSEPCVEASVQRKLCALSS